VADGGNGLFAAGGRIFFGATDGFFHFDGINTRLLSNVIRRDWAALGTFKETGAAAERMGFSFADDPANGILYVCAYRSDQDSQRPVLCYHYTADRGDGVGLWTTMDESYGYDTEATLTCVATARHPQGGVERYSPVICVGRRDPLAGGTPYSVVLASDPFDDSLVLPIWEWRSGQIPLARGLKQQLLYVKWFLASGTEELANPPVVFLRVFPDNAQVDSELKLHDVRQGDAVQRIGRTASRMTLSIQPSPQWVRGFDPGLGLLGWEPRAELVGAY